MDGDGINIRLDTLAKLEILGYTKREIAQRLVEEYTRTPDFKKMLESIEIDLNGVKEAVLDNLVNQIISKWVKDQKSED